MNINEPISVCISPGTEFTKSLIEILLHSNIAVSLAALQATVPEEGEHRVTYPIEWSKVCTVGDQDQDLFCAHTQIDKQ